MLILKLNPHIESAGHHTYRFDAYLEDRLIVTSRQPIYAGARALIDLDHDPATAMCGEHPNGTQTMFGTIGEHAKWTVTDTSRGGITKTLWSPMPENAFAAHP